MQLKTYKLFLDESLDKEKKKFVVAGFAIESGKEMQINQRIYDAKKILWDEACIKNNETVLHCTELSVIKNNRKNKRIQTILRGIPIDYLRL